MGNLKKKFIATPLHHLHRIVILFIMISTRNLIGTVVRSQNQSMLIARSLPTTRRKISIPVVNLVQKRNFAVKVPIELVKELRNRTQAGVLNCKKALEASELDMEKAIEILKKEGALLASKNTNNVAAEGLCGVAVDGHGSAVLV